MNYEKLDNAPEKLQPIANLISWGENYSWETSPTTLFLEMVGYWEEETGGVAGVQVSRIGLGYLELGLIGAACSTYSDYPQDTFDFIRSVFSDDEKEEAA